MEPFKVFLSHSTKDKKFVEKLAAALRHEGIEPWLCEVDIIPADNLVAKIKEGLSISDLTILVWSPEAARSPWTGAESMSVLDRGDAGSLTGCHREVSRREGWANPCAISPPLDRVGQACSGRAII